MLWRVTDLWLQEFCKIATKFPYWYLFEERPAFALEIPSVESVSSYSTGAQYRYVAARNMAEKRFWRVKSLSGRSPNRINDGRRFEVGMLLRFSRYIFTVGSGQFRPRHADIDDQDLPHDGGNMTGRTFDLTIIIASYNTRELLRDCLQSVYQHTQGVRFEVICVDDNSPDCSADMVAESFPQVILVRNQQRLLYAKNHNLATRMARGRYVCHLDSDTLLTHDAMSALVQFMDENPAVAACGPRLLNGDGSIQHCIRSFAGAGTFLLQALNWHKLFPNSAVMNRYYNANFDYARPQKVQSIGTSAYVVRRETWESAGMFDDRFGQFMVDLAYNFTLNRRGYSVWYTPCAEVVHYGSRSIGQEPIAALRAETEAFILFNESYGYFRQDWLSRKLVRGTLKARLLLRLAEYHFGMRKPLAKGPVGAYALASATPVPSVRPVDN